jgi:imidazolonepropionase-like amidohydrolase
VRHRDSRVRFLSFAVIVVTATVLQLGAARQPARVAAMSPAGPAAAKTPPSPSATAGLKLRALAATTAPQHAQSVKRLLIQNAMIVYGNGKPAYGPTDILVQDGLIAKIGRSSPGDAPPDAVIDATGKYVLPGLINTHMHLQDERGGVPQPLQYEMNLYLASGVTTVRDVSSDWAKAKQWRAQSNAHTLVAPRMLIYSTLWMSKGMKPAQIPEGVRFAKAEGVDGLKLFGMDRDQAEAVLDEAHKQGLRTAVHIAVEETNAKDYAELDVTSIEHFYGVADAALDGIQHFPPDHNASNEIHRFGRAGELYLQSNLNREKLSDVLDLMINHKVTWCPTMDAYVASRDLIRAQNVPWFRDYLHPTMEEYWKPGLEKHGSYFFGWTHTQEVRWQKDFLVWMGLLREFSNKGGVITVGDDAGFIYNLYGFGYVRELELMEEAGFEPLEVIKHATVNGAQLLGLEDRLGRIREGYIADLIVVNGNPLDNLRVLNPYGVDIVTLNGQPVSNYAPLVPGDRNIKLVHGGGIEWTIKEGIPYHVPTLMKETKAMVAQARAELARKEK